MKFSVLHIVSLVKIIIWVYQNSLSKNLVHFKSVLKYFSNIVISLMEFIFYQELRLLLFFLWNQDLKFFSKLYYFHIFENNWPWVTGPYIEWPLWLFCVTAVTNIIKEDISCFTSESMFICAFILFISCFLIIFYYHII